MEEINILKKLRHRHVIKLVGSYIQEPYLGLLLHPVAVTDLATLIEDYDFLQYSQEPQDFKRINQAIDRIQQLHPGHGAISVPVYRSMGADVLQKTLGCLASAVAYLHQNRVRHKDLKPSNVLLNPGGLLLTDFGTATNFSEFTRSVTENGERGTPKYFSPEAANYHPCGRASDIFSLGCIFLEIVGLLDAYSLEELKRMRSKGDRSFQANLENIGDICFAQNCRTTYSWLKCEVALMLKARPQSRPTITQVQDRLTLLESLYHPDPERLSFYFDCCRERNTFRSLGMPIMGMDILICNLTVGNTHSMCARTPDYHDWMFFVWPSNRDIVDKVYCFLVSAANPWHRNHTLRIF